MQIYEFLWKNVYSEHNSILGACKLGQQMHVVKTLKLGKKIYKNFDFRFDF